MNRNILFFIISLFFCANINGQSYKETLNKALASKDMKKAEEILKSWEYADSNDPELYISYSNYYTIMSQAAATALNPTGYDSNYSKKAVEFITYGIERFPTRFDIRIIKIYLLVQLNDYTSFTTEIIKMIDFSNEIQNNWKGRDFETIENAEVVFLGAISDFQDILYNENRASLYANMIKISEAMLKHYPNHIQSMIDISTIYVKQEKYKESINILTKANVEAPENAIVDYNLAFVYNLMGDKVNAKKFYELVLVNAKEKEQSLKEGALRHLKELQ